MRDRIRVIPGEPFDRIVREEIDEPLKPRRKKSVFSFVGKHREGLKGLIWGVYIANLIVLLDAVVFLVNEDYDSMLVVCIEAIVLALIAALLSIINDAG